ncbi:MAG: T9SS type A sorting domain-containing protein [Bacteroidetes bacterium]|nr:T9SS type A sorting domain-containing protein [Bacteroidota bacterium]
MKKTLLSGVALFVLTASSFAQTKLTNNPDLTITTGNSVTCNSGVNSVENHFFQYFDLADYVNISDTAFFIRMQVACESTAGGAYDIVAKMHSAVGTANLANLTLIISDTVAATPDATMYLTEIPFTGGYALPGDSLAGEFNLPISGTASFFPGSNASPESNPTYIVADGCGIMDLTTMSAVGFPDMHLIMNIYVNQKPTLAGFATNVLNNAQLNFLATDFTSQFADGDSDGLTMMKVVTVPANGVLDLGGTALAVGDTILDTELSTVTYTPNSGYVGSDNFSLIARDTTHWSNTPAVVDITVTDYQAGLVENQTGSVSLYPNPASKQITVQVTETIQQIRIFTVEGKLLMTRVSDETLVDISKLENGVYILEVKTASGLFTSRFIKD